MKINDSNPTAYYDFETIRRTYNLTTILQIPDSEDYINFFRIYLAATTRKKLEEFIQYQEEKDWKGIEISVDRIESAEDVKKKVYRLGDDVPWLSFGDNYDLLVDDSKLVIGISRLYISTPTPHRITYTIDPILSERSVRKGFKSFSAGFNMPQADGVRVDVETGGRINATLEELSPTGYWIERQRQDNVEISYTFPRTDSKGTGGWRVTAFGLALESEVTFRYIRDEHH